nr:hypothetical protein [Gammaproteobacteria bacterium]
MSASGPLLHRNERRVAYFIRRLVSAYAATFDYAGRVVGPLLDLYLRLWLAQTFFISGVLKATQWDNALALARYEYPVSWMDPPSRHRSQQRLASGGVWPGAAS